MARNTLRLNDRGVSEAIGFMLIFTIIIAGIGLVTLYGYPLLLKQQVSADEKIMEKNMIVLQNDIKSLAYKTVPFKETSLKIGGGSLTVYNSSYSPPSSIFEINDASGASYLPPYTAGTKFIPGELRYESVSAQTDISLQNGAVVLRPRIKQGSTSGSAMIAQPRWFFDEKTNTMVINLINITSTSIMAKEGIGTVQMELAGQPYYNETFIPSGQSVIIVYTPNPNQDYSVAWDNYIWNTWNVPQSYKLTAPSGGPPGTGSPITYTLKNTGSSPMGLVIKIFTANIRSI
jgi:hypothetical protein